jgi:hypothetical protein
MKILCGKSPFRDGVKKAKAEAKAKAKSKGQRAEGRDEDCAVDLPLGPG